MDSQRLIQVFLVGLPLSIIGLGVFAMFYYFRGGTTSEQIEFTNALMRKPVEKEELRACVLALADKIGERNLAKGRSQEIAAKFLESSLGVSNMGYQVRQQRFRTPDGYDCVNLEVELTGTGRRGEIVVVGAHYDSASGSPGANDNATGVAALLGLANAFVGSKNLRTLRFVAFANEEPPYFQKDGMGSRQYAKRCRERNENVVAMLCLESLGYYSDEEGSQRYPEPLAARYPSTANFIAFVSNHQSRGLLEEILEAFQRKSDFPFQSGAFSPDTPGVAWSDHWSFWQAGYEAVMVTDTAPFRYPHYHKASDTPDKVDFDRLFEVVLGLEEVVRSLVNPH